MSDILDFLRSLPEFPSFVRMLKEKRFSNVARGVKDKILTIMTSENVSEHVRAFFINPAAQGQPFSDFDVEPEQVSQIKKIINAIYYAELTLKDVEEKSYLELLGGHLNTLSHQIYQCAYNITHVDIDVSAMFREELELLKPILETFYRFSRRCSARANEFIQDVQEAEEAEEYNLPHEIGAVSGIIVDQMGGGHDGNVDYEFITRYSAILPGYLDRLSHALQTLSSEVSAHGPTIDQRKLDELQDQALRLLSSIENARGSGSLFMSLKVLHILYIIHHTITLAMSIIRQLGHLTESGQNMVRAKLSQLKYEILPALFGFTDKLEEQGMLTPGTLTKPAMVHVSRFYQALMTFIKNYVDFNETGVELLTIEDAWFTEKRLEHAYNHLAADEKTLVVLAEVKRSAYIFFAQLKSYDSERLLDLDDEKREQLGKHYKVIQPYVIEVNPQLNNQIIVGLTQPKAPSDDSYVRLGMRGIAWMGTNLAWVCTAGYYGGSAPLTLLRRDVIVLEELITGMIDKKIGSCQLHSQLNRNIIQSVAKTNVEEFKVYPYNRPVNRFAIDEAVILGVVQPQAIVGRDAEGALQFAVVRAAFHNRANQVTNLDVLTFEQLIKLYQSLRVNQEKLQLARDAYHRFCHILSQPERPPFLNEFSVVLKKELRQLYGIFQPYVFSALSALEPNMTDHDKKIIAALAPGEAEIAQVHRADLTLQQIRSVGGEMNLLFVSAEEHLKLRTAAIAERIRFSIHQENLARPLEEDYNLNDRAAYVIKHQNYSKAIADFRHSLDQLLVIFNDSVREQLRQAPQGLPYPDMQDDRNTLIQSEQIVGIKRLFNCVFFLEQICVDLEAIYDTSIDKYKEAIYAKNIIMAIYHVYKTISLAMDIVYSPNLLIIANEIKLKLQDAYTKLLIVRGNYIPEPAVPAAIEQSTTHKAILYVLNVVHVLPDHITALLAGRELSPENAQEIHAHCERLTVSIERIITNSNSYFKLFLQIPTMYRLFRDLKQKFTEMTGATYEAVHQNLAYINNELLTKMIVEADIWEEKLSLVSGTLSKPMKAFVDSFYQGLLEPLQLSSQRHVSLVSSMIPLEKRIAAVALRVETAAQEKNAIQQNQMLLRQLLTEIRAYETAVSNRLRGEPFLRLKRNVVAAFTLALPIIREAKPHITGITIPPGNLTSRGLDTLLNNSIPVVPGQPAEQNLSNITALSQVCFDYLEGISASKSLSIAAGDEKKTYLNSLIGMQVQSNAQFVVEYTTRCFNKQVAALANKQVGLIHFSDHYNQELSAFLKEGIDAIVFEAKAAEVIDQKITELLRARAGEFERNNYRNYYQLEKIKAAIGGLETYLYNANLKVNNNSSLFESGGEAGTLTKKTKLLNRLRRLAGGLPADEHVADDVPLMPIAQRLEKLKAEIEKPAFKTTLFDYHHYDSFTYAWLKQCVMSLIELVTFGLYTPDRKKCYRQLKKATEAPEDIGQLSAQFGLFSGHARNYNIPSLEESVLQNAIVPL